MSSTHSSDSKNPCGENENPTRTILEQTLAALDNGNYAVSFPSGTATQSCLIATLKAGDGIICGDNIYTGTIELFRETAVDLGLNVEFVDMTKPDEVRRALKANTKMVWVETPSNPMMLITDIKAIVEIVHSHRESDAIVVVDNTPLSCYFQRPLELGADAVSYSITKFMNGHNDVVM
jgi:cystathionine gamma-lyase